MGEHFIIILKLIPFIIIVINKYNIYMNLKLIYLINRWKKNDYIKNMIFNLYLYNAKYYLIISINLCFYLIISIYV